MTGDACSTDPAPSQFGQTSAASTSDAWSLAYAATGAGCWDNPARSACHSSTIVTDGSDPLTLVQTRVSARIFSLTTALSNVLARSGNSTSGAVTALIEDTAVAVPPALKVSPKPSTAGTPSATGSASATAPLTAFAHQTSGSMTMSSTVPKAWMVGSTN